MMEWVGLLVWQRLLALANLVNKVSVNTFVWQWALTAGSIGKSKCMTKTEATKQDSER